jgi:hypothetical protein
MEGNCPDCRLGFTVCVDGCVVRDAKAAREREITRLRKLVTDLGGTPGPEIGDEEDLGEAS